MSFVSFLKKAGQILANVGAVEAGLEPIFKSISTPAVGAQLDKLDLIFKSVVATEGQFTNAFPGQQTGASKLLAASTLVGPVLATVDTIRGKPIANEAAYIAAIQKITGGLADLLNAIQPKASPADAAATLTAPATAVSITVPPPPCS